MFHFIALFSTLRNLFNQGLAICSKTDPREAKQSTSTDKGFTLIEILVVIAVISLLAGIVLVVMGPARERAKNARIQSDMLQFQNLAEGFYLDEGNYNKVDPDLSLEVAALSDDLDNIRGQTDSLKIYKSALSADQYCASTGLLSIDSGLNLAFCVDFRGFAGKIPIVSFYCYGSNAVTCGDFCLANVTCDSCFDWDGDGDLDVDDLCFAFKGDCCSCSTLPGFPFGSYIGDPDYNSRVDFDSDGDIDTFDLLALKPFMTENCWE